MILCHCRVVSDRTVRWAVEGGACDVDDVGARCGAGTRCGGCRHALAELLAEMAARRPVPAPAAPPVLTGRHA